MDATFNYQDDMEIIRIQDDTDYDNQFDFDFDYDPNEMYYALQNDPE